MKTSESATVMRLWKSPTGIEGFDEITNGGLPRGRPTLLCGGAGSGKTLFSMEFLIHGAVEFNEPGVFIAFEENEKELIENTASIGWDLQGLIRNKQLLLDYIYIEPSEIEETGEYNLDGLFVRIDHAVNTIKAKRVVLDTIETLFTGFSNPGLLRAELRRLFRWLKEKELTAIITGEKANDGSFTRHGIEEYVSDCVVGLDHRMSEQVAVRRLRVHKYRGSVHGTNEYPFLITGKGFSVLPITDVGMNYSVSSERISTGIPQLDAMFGGKGYFRGSSALISGSPGTGKSSFAAAFAEAACRRDERTLYMSFEESQDQIMRNMRSIGMDLKKWRDQKLLEFFCSRSSSFGLETHLALMLDHIAQLDPQVVVVDPISNLTLIASRKDVKEAFTRLIDFMKMRNITALFTSLSSAGTSLEGAETEISSLMDSWVLLKQVEHDGARDRALYVLKSRGMPHSHKIQPFRITNSGFEFDDSDNEQTIPDSITEQ